MRAVYFKEWKKHLFIVLVGKYVSTSAHLSACQTGMVSHSPCNISHRADILLCCNFYRGVYLYHCKTFNALSWWACTLQTLKRNCQPPASYRKSHTRKHVYQTSLSSHWCESYKRMPNISWHIFKLFNSRILLWVCGCAVLSILLGFGDIIHGVTDYMWCIVGKTFSSSSFLPSALPICDFYIGAT